MIIACLIMIFDWIWRQHDVSSATDTFALAPTSGEEDTHSED